MSVPIVGKRGHPAAFTEVDRLFSWVKLTSQLPTPKSEIAPYETFNRVYGFAKATTLRLSASGAETRGGP
jgi:hypothetical protein